MFLLLFQFVLKIFFSMIQWFVWKFLASFFVSIMSSYLAFGWSFIWLVIPFVSYRDGAISFWSFIFGHTICFHTGMVPYSFLFVLYFFGLTICFSGMVPFSFYSFEFESLEAFVGRYILDIVRQVEISSICRICFQFAMADLVGIDSEDYNSSSFIFIQI